jgi:tripartite-type tricarboxylate transporter receptor subunit TctC
MAVVSAVAVLATACSGDTEEPASADPTGATGAEASSCYRGETVSYVVPYPPGGGYDTIARAIDPFLEEELGATVVIENRPGAGGLLAANELYNAPADGLTFGLFPGEGLVGSHLAEASGASFDPLELTYIARLAVEPRLVIAGEPSDIDTVEDLLTDDNVRYATTGVGGSDHIDAILLPRILGIEDSVEVITGFDGISEITPAAVRGDVDVASGSVGSRIKVVKSGDFVPVLIVGRERSDLVPDVPAILELDPPGDPGLLEGYLGLQEVGRVLIAPPGVEEACVTELQDAIESVIGDAEFQETMQRAVDVPLEYTSGSETRAIVEEVLSAPEELVELLRKAYTEE